MGAGNDAHEELEFLRFALSHLESRIALLDQKAGLLWAGLSLMVGADFTLLGLLCGGGRSGGAAWGLTTLVFAGLTMGLLLLASWFLLHVVRPSPLWGGGAGRSCFSERPPARYHLWFDPFERSAPGGLEDAPLSGQEIRAQLLYAIRGLRCLAYHKQANYRKAAQLAKALVLVLAIGSLWAVVFTPCGG